MSQLGVKAYAAQIGAGIGASLQAKTTTFTHIDSYRQVPKLEKLGSGLAVIIGPIRYREERIAVPRGGGWKTRDYTLTVWIHAAGKDEQAVGDDFDTAVELVCEAYETAAIPTSVTDPKTGAATQVLILGEQIEVDTYEPQTGSVQGHVRFFAEIRLSATETVQA